MLFIMNSIDNVELLKEARGGVSHWGHRVISIPGYRGYFRLDAIEQKFSSPEIKRLHLEGEAIRLIEHRSSWFKIV